MTTRERERELRLLEELKQGEIAQAITCGLNPNVTMKPTGISWLPFIPEHWQLVRIKYIFRECDEKNENLEYQLLSFSRKKGIVPFEDLNEKAPSASDLRKYKIIRPNQLLENRMQAWSGMFGCSKITGCVSPDYSVFEALNGNITEYFAYLFRTPIYVQQFANASKGIGDGFNRLYTPQFGRIMAVVPPIEEQKQIVKHIENRLNSINSLITELQSEIDFLNEYKQRLISDAVTGQINVQND